MKAKASVVAGLLIVTLFAATSGNGQVGYYPYYGATHHVTWSAALLAGELETEDRYLISQGVMDRPYGIVTDGDSMVIAYELNRAGAWESGALRLDMDGNIIQEILRPASWSEGIFTAVDMDRDGDLVAAATVDSEQGAAIRFLGVSPDGSERFDTVIYAGSETSVSRNQAGGVGVTFDDAGNAIGVMNLFDGSDRNTFIAKVDDQGGQIWAKTIPVDGSHEAADLVTLGDDGSIYVSGTRNNDGPFFLKLDHQGELIDDVGFDEQPLVSPEGTLWGGSLKKMKFGDDGHLYVSGSQSHDLALDGLPHDRAIVAKLTPDLEVVWVQNINVGAWTYGGAFDFHPDGSVLMTGTATDSLGPSVPGGPGSDVRKQFVARVDQDGDVLWARINDDMGDSNANGIVAAVTPDGDSVYSFGLISRPGTFIGADMFGAKGPTDSTVGEVAGFTTTWDNRVRNVVYPPPDPFIDSPFGGDSPVMTINLPFFGATISGPDGQCVSSDHLDAPSVGGASLVYQEDQDSGESTTTITVVQPTRPDGCPPTATIEVTVGVPAWGEQVEETEVSADGCVTTTTLVDLNSRGELVIPGYVIQKVVNDECAGLTWSSQAFLYSPVGV